MPSPIPRAGVIGTGFIGPVHIEALKRLSIPVTAVCGSDKALDLAQQWSIPEVYTGYDYQALIDSPNVDVVHITSPNRHHYAQALAVLKAGKHCVCEKPLAMTATETAELVAAAEASSAVFAVNYNIRFYPAMLQLRAMIAAGELGDIIHVNGSYFQDWLLYDTDFNWRLMADEGGALRAVGDIGTHWMDLATFVLGSPITAALADLRTYYTTRRRPLGSVETFSRGGDQTDYAPYTVDTEDFGSILLRFANGARGNVAVSQVAAGRKNCLRLEVYGTRMSASWNAEAPNDLNLGHRSQPNAVLMRNTEPYHDATRVYMDYPPGHNEGFPDTFKMLYRTVYDAIQDGKPAAPLYADASAGHHEILVCEAIERSHKEQRWIEIAA